MILYPAIDLKNGQCVRLLRGDMAAATVYGDDPAAQARSFAEAGCDWLHLVDLDGAVEGRAANAEAVEAILAAVSLPVQLGGGIRDFAGIERWLSRGVRRVVLGTIAVENPGIVADAAAAFPGGIAVGIDARRGSVATHGWTKDADVSAIDLGRRFEDAGIDAVVYTDIDRDGAMQGPNVAATVELARAISIPVIASGGVSSIDDLRALAATGVVAGAISGRALYDGTIDLPTALSVLRGTG